jgi:RND family efflux transporter MFP subunit
MKKNKKNLIFIVPILIILIAGGFFGFKEFSSRSEKAETQTISIKNLNSSILADGSVVSESEATLHFQTGGKVTYLPLKEGDKVYKGQTIAKLDNFALQKQLSQALNNYQATRDNFDQAQENGQNGVAQGQQKFLLDTQNKVAISSDDKNAVSDDIVKRLLDQQQLSLNNSVANVDLANYAIELSSLQSPISGVLIHEDVTTANTVVSPSNSFVVADLSKLIFKSFVPENYIQLIKVGDQATIKIQGDDHNYQGSVSKIYPDATKLNNGQTAYEVDIKSDDLAKNVKYNQNGSVVFNLNNADNISVVPSWLVINKQFIWVKNDTGFVEKTITVGKSFGDQIQITSGLDQNDQIVSNPEVIGKNKYLLF